MSSRKGHAAGRPGPGLRVHPRTPLHPGIGGGGRLAEPPRMTPMTSTPTSGRRHFRTQASMPASAGTMPARTQRQVPTAQTASALLVAKLKSRAGSRRSLTLPALESAHRGSGPRDGRRPALELCESRVWDATAPARRALLLRNTAPSADRRRRPASRRHAGEKEGRWLTQPRDLLWFRRLGRPAASIRGEARGACVPLGRTGSGLADGVEAFAHRSLGRGRPSPPGTGCRVLMLV